jgi:hypothetical protein
LVFVLVLTAVDYALWHWSIADGHDVVSLVAGLTLLPLAAVGVGGLALMVARLLGLFLGSSSARARTNARARRASRGASPAEQAPQRPAAEQDSSSSKLAA